MTHIPTTFTDYSPHEALTNLISVLPKNRPLEGYTIVISGYVPYRRRAQERAALETLGATTRDYTSSVSPTTIVLVNRYANKQWKYPPEKGCKLDRARNKDARIFRMGDFLILLRQHQGALPDIFELTLAADFQRTPPEEVQVEFEFMQRTA